MGAGQEHILLVDDSRSARSQISGILSAAGFQVVIAEDGQAGLELLRLHQVDLIVSDLEMPRLDGLGLCRAVKSDEKLRSIYFIMLTGREELEARVRGLDSGADAYIVKTTHQDEFLARIRAGMRIRHLERELAAAQAQLLHAEKLASLGQLAAGVAHEINNPIGFIISNLGVLKKYFERLGEFVAGQERRLAPTSCPPELREAEAEARRQLKVDYLLADGRELVNESVAGAERIAGIVNKLRDSVEIEEYAQGAVDLNRQLELGVDFIQQEYGPGLPLNLELEPLPPICGSSNQLDQVFANLLRNATQAIVDGGEIVISSCCEGDEIIVSVVDTGCGISAERLSRIFDPFFTTREVGQGSGLGLTIAYDIVKKHGGAIAVDSQPGRGTTVTVRFPVRA